DDHAFKCRSGYRGDESRQILVDLILGHEAMGIAALMLLAVAITRQRALPVGRYQTECIPALSTPGVRQAVLFQQQMIDAVGLQKMAGGQPRLPATDDDDAVM